MYFDIICLHILPFRPMQTNVYSDDVNTSNMQTFANTASQRVIFSAPWFVDDKGMFFSYIVFPAI